LLADAIRRDHRIQVVASVSTSHDLLEILARLAVDVVVISSNLDERPDHGFQVLGELRLSHPGLGTLLLLESSRREAVVEAFRLGAKGVFSKNGSTKNLCKCIRSLQEGQIWANRQELRFIVEALAATPGIRAVNASGMNLLSARELEVVRWLTEGLTNREIGERLGLSKHTIKNYLLRIFDKLGVSNRVELLYLTLSTSNAARNSKDIEGNCNYGKAAEQGLPEAQFRLAHDYEHGTGVQQDLVAAYMWSLLSEQASLELHNQANRLKRRLAESMTLEQILDAERKAVARSKSPMKPPVCAVVSEGGNAKVPGPRNMSCPSGSIASAGSTPETKEIA